MGLLCGFRALTEHYNAKQTDPRTTAAIAWRLQVPKASFRLSHLGVLTVNSSATAGIEHYARVREDPYQA